MCNFEISKVQHDFNLSPFDKIVFYEIRLNSVVAGYDMIANFLRDKK